MTLWVHRRAAELTVVPDLERSESAADELIDEAEEALASGNPRRRMRAIPVGLAYNLFLDRLIQGFTAAAVKG